MLNKIRLLVRNLKMLAVGIVSLIVSLVSGIYSGLSQHLPFMLSHPFRWLPVSRFYKDALQAISQLERMHPIERGYYEDAEGIPKQQLGRIGITDKGFKELVESLRIAEITNQPVDTIELVQSIKPIWNTDSNGLSENETLTLRIFQNDKVVKELSDKPMEILKSAIERASQRRFAILTWILTAGLFVIGIVLILIDIRSKK